jgi:signal peptidase
MRAALRTVNFAIRGLTLAIMISLLVMAIGLLCLRARGDRLISVETASMVPAFRPGDALLSVPVPVNDLRAGEVISYRSPRDPRVTVSHRLIHIDGRHGMLTTAGDTLGSDDPPFPATLVAGKVVAIVPNFGFVIDGARRPIVLALTIFVPGVLLVYSECQRALRLISRPVFQLRGHKT